jgi:hypothetical protein
MACRRRSAAAYLRIPANRSRRSAAYLRIPVNRQRLPRPICASPKIGRRCGDPARAGHRQPRGSCYLGGEGGVAVEILQGRQARWFPVGAFCGGYGRRRHAWSPQRSRRLATRRPSVSRWSVLWRVRAASSCFESRAFAKIDNETTISLTEDQVAQPHASTGAVRAERASLRPALPLDPPHGQLPLRGQRRYRPVSRRARSADSSRVGREIGVAAGPPTSGPASLVPASSRADPGSGSLATQSAIPPRSVPLVRLSPPTAGALSHTVQPRQISPNFVRSHAGHTKEKRHGSHRVFLVEAPGIETPAKGRDPQGSRRFPHATGAASVPTTAAKCAKPREPDESRTSKRSPPGSAMGAVLQARTLACLHRGAERVAFADHGA